MVCSPIAHHKALEAELILQQIVEGVAILAAIAVVDSARKKIPVVSDSSNTASDTLSNSLIVATHDRSCASPNSICERPQIQLVHRDIVQICRNRGSEIGRRCTLSEVLLLVHDEMLCARHDAGILDTLNGLADSDTSKDRVRRETFWL